MSESPEMNSAAVTVLRSDDPAFDTLVAEVAAIAASRELASDAAPGSEWERTGFLSAGYGLEKYRDLARDGRIPVIRDAGKIVAFSAIDRPDTPIDASDFSYLIIRDRYGAVPVMRQIVTAPGHTDKGYARRLYEHLAEQFPEQPLLAIIVETPRNLRSEGFHARMNFSKCDGFATPEGKLRGIWRRPAKVT